jgi:hypothetical protein
MLDYKRFGLPLQPLFLIKSPKIYGGVASTAEIMQRGMILE